MCAGRCREPRCIRSPCRGSQRLRRALGGTRILLAAAPTAPPCFCRWQRSSLLHRGFFTRRTIRRVDAVRIHPCNPFCKTDKTETPIPIGYRSSWWARVDYASRASKKAPQGLFSPPDYSAGRCCSNPPLQPLFKADKPETPVPGSDTGVLGGRGWIARATLLKTAHWAVFALSSATAPQLFESTRSMSLALSQNKSLSALAYAEAFWWSEAT